MKSMFEEVENCQKIMRENFNKPLQMTNRYEEAFGKATHCHICKRKYKPADGENIPVRDHCHIPGKYRGSAHKKCNLKLQISAEKIKIPVIFHNLRGYDSHFIINQLGEIISEGEQPISIDVIPCNAEKYMAFYINNHLSFIDSFQFMSSSLEKLAGNLSEEGFIYTGEYFTDERQFQLMKAKGVYPYDYMDSFSKFNDTQLPRREDFYSLLTNEDISEDDYNHAQEVWNTFEVKNMGEYHDLYLKSDVLLLADVFENFRRASLLNCGLDPCHYVSIPGLSWDAMLKMTGINLELITDIDMQLFIEKGIRGGISYIAHRHAKANNPYMDFYNLEDDKTYIIYLGANNLYGWAMSQPLPYRNFKWVEPKYYVQKVKGIGMIYEVDLEYPDELHHLHNDYPCAAEKLCFTDEMLSHYCKEIKKYCKISSGNVRKLIPTLRDKENYVLHEENLKLYLSLGLRLKRVHRVLQFDEKPWLKEYIDFNTEMRKNSKNDFEKDYFKLMNNSVFGKTMENIRKRCNVYLETDPDHFMLQTAKPTYVSGKIFHENLVAVNMKRERLKLDKPSYVGMCLLDLSKVLMYDFHYNYIKEKYGEKAKLLFTDTNSLCYVITTDDVYEDLYHDRDLFDNSDYAKSSKFFFDENKKVIGKFKDEAAGNPIIEFVGLKSKMYSYKIETETKRKKIYEKMYLLVNTKNNKTAKGVKKNVIKRDLHHSHYLACLQNNTIMSHKMRTIRSDHHVISSYEINKTSLSCFDDKRYIHHDGKTSYAYGHYMIIKPKKMKNHLILYDSRRNSTTLCRGR